MISLFPDEVVEDLKQKYGDSFARLSELERSILIIAGSEECVNHRRMKELVKDHPHDISQALHALVEKGFIEREGSGNGTFYYLIGEHPMQDEMFGAQVGRSEQMVVSSEHLTGNMVHLGPTPEQWDRLMEIAKPIRESSKVKSKKIIEDIILVLCADNYLTLDELHHLLNREKDSLRNHYVNRMIEEGKLIPKYKNIPNHPKQGYMAVSRDEGQNG